MNFNSRVSYNLNSKNLERLIPSLKIFAIFAPHSKKFDVRIFFEYF